MIKNYLQYVNNLKMRKRQLSINLLVFLNQWGEKVKQVTCLLWKQDMTWHKPKPMSHLISVVNWNYLSYLATLIHLLLLIIIGPERSYYSSFLEL